MSDDLVARCEAEVREVMERTSWACAQRGAHCNCATNDDLVATLGRMMAAEYRRGWADARIDAGYVPPKCERGGTDG